MKKEWIWIVTAVVLVALLVGAWFLYDSLKDGYQPEALPTQPTDPTAEADGEERMKAPEITVYDGNGDSVKLSDMQGKPVVLNVWASWCGPCKQEMPDFQAAFEKYDGQIHFMMVNLTGQDTIGDAKALLEQTGYTFPVYWDNDNLAAINYNTGSIPATFFINAKGEMVTYAIGAINAELLEKGIGMIQ